MTKTQRINGMIQATGVRDPQRARLAWQLARTSAYKMGLGVFSGSKTSARLYARRPFAAW